MPALHQMKGLVYFRQKKFVPAREQYELAIRLYQKSGQVARSSYAYNALYHLDFGTGNYKPAAENLSKAHELEKVSGLKEKQRMAKLMEITYPRLFGLVSRTTGPLSHSERIFAFMLAIGHSNEAIAAYFNVEPSSLRKTRQRIREKLKLEKGVELRRYFQNLIKL